MTNILVVEDDPDLRFLYRTTLTHNGMGVVEAESVTIAMAELDHASFDLIMLDLNLPDHYGTAVIDYMRQSDRHNHTKILVVTANDHWIDAVLERGVSKILVKPV